ncbi:MAG: electron transfer flavoprotein subunit beta/FixA family protein [Candidatus Gastranaerophilales bacterium]|nr:electron transfer flavoprotein subunit beta/FixA family protein [Candidatus Gastranaerophilales bacterium]
MDIIVCVKQVPDVDDIKWTKENNLDRSMMLSKINKYDDWALNWALNIKSKFKDVKITVLSMGPKPACDILNYALAKGCDRAILLCDKMFAASDTLATSKILARAIEKYIPNYNIILTGQMAQDGDTAQVPVSLSQLLNIVDITNAIEIVNADKNIAIVKQKLEDKVNIYEARTPCLIAIKEEYPNVFYPKIEGYIKAQNKGIEEYCFEDLELQREDVGIIGSPTIVYKAFRPEINKKTTEIDKDCSDFILELVQRVEIE